MQDQPSIENVAPSWRYLVYPSVGEQYKQHGAVVSMFGSSTCPWCDEKTMESKTIGSFLGVCKKNPAHIVQWIPWGG